MAAPDPNEQAPIQRIFGLSYNDFTYLIVSHLVVERHVDTTGEDNHVNVLLLNGADEADPSWLLAAHNAYVTTSPTHIATHLEFLDPLSWGQLFLIARKRSFFAGYTFKASILRAYIKLRIKLLTNAGLTQTPENVELFSKIEKRDVENLLIVALENNLIVINATQTLSERDFGQFLVKEEMIDILTSKIVTQVLVERILERKAGKDSPQYLTSNLKLQYRIHFGDEELLDLVLERVNRDLPNLTNMSKESLVGLLREADQADPSWLLLADEVFVLTNTKNITTEQLNRLSDLSWGQLHLIQKARKFTGIGFRYEDIPLRAYIKLRIMLDSDRGIQKTNNTKQLFSLLKQAQTTNIVDEGLKANIIRVGDLTPEMRKILFGDQYFYQSISLEDAIETLVTKNLTVEVFKRIQAKQVRFQEFKRSIRLSRLYHFLHPDLTLYSEIIHVPVHPMEALIIMFEGTKMGVPQPALEFNSNLVQRLGIMVTPSFIGKMHSDYIVNILNILNENLPYYAHILTRGKLPAYSLTQLATLPSNEIENYLHKLTDQEILALCGTFLPYNVKGRLKIVHYVTERILSPGFILPWHKDRDYEIDPRHSLVEETISGVEITDKSVNFVAYGTLTRHTPYTTAELLGAFYKDETSGIMAFRHPENYKLRFTLPEAKFLRKISPRTTEGRALLDRILEIEEYLENTENYVKEMQSELVTLSANVSDRDLIHEFLQSLFKTGMYMRRWKGPGHSYPYTAKEATCSFDPEPLTRDNLIIGVNLLNRMSVAAKDFVLNLRIVNYNQQGKIEVGDTAFKTVWVDIAAGTACIRVASTKFVATAYYYLEKLYSEIIPNVKDRVIEQIL